MASVIFFGSIHPYKICWSLSLGNFRGVGRKAEIAKGNIIEGIEAKE